MPDSRRVSTKGIEAKVFLATKSIIQDQISFQKKKGRPQSERPIIHEKTT